MSWYSHRSPCAFSACSVGQASKPDKSSLSRSRTCHSASIRVGCSIGLSAERASITQRTWLAATTESGATNLLATSSTANWLIWACMPLINQETLEETHGTANSEISLSLITSITQKIIGIPRMTGQSFIPGSSITMAI